MWASTFKYLVGLVIFYLANFSSILLRSTNALRSGRFWHFRGFKLFGSHNSAKKHYSLNKVATDYCAKQCAILKFFTFGVFYFCDGASKQVALERFHGNQLRKCFTNWQRWKRVFGAPERCFEMLSVWSLAIERDGSNLECVARREHVRFCARISTHCA